MYINKIIKLSILVCIFIGSILSYVQPVHANDYCFHAKEYVERVEPTTCSQGMYAHFYCNHCDKYFGTSFPYTEVSKESLIIQKLPCLGVYVSPIEPTCIENGNIGYWYCEQCNKFYLNEDCTIEIAYEDTILLATGHNLTYFPYVEPTCTSDGNIEYWYCSNCELFFLDEQCTIVTAYEDTLLLATGHNVTYYPNVIPTCTSDGNIEYWYCSNCDSYFLDEQCTIVTAYEDTILLATGHNLTYYPSVVPTCTSDGNIEYWYCSNCELFFLDQQGTVEIAYEDTILLATGHDLTYYPGNNPTCCTKGNIPYWYCPICNIYFIDEQATIEITYEDTILESLGHTVLHNEATTPTVEMTGNVEYWYYTECNKYFLDELCTIEVTYEDTIIPRLTNDIIYTGDSIALSSNIIKLSSISWFIIYQYRKLKKK